MPYIALDPANVPHVLIFKKRPRAEPEDLEHNLGLGVAVAAVAVAEADEVGDIELGGELAALAVANRLPVDPEIDGGPDLKTENGRKNVKSAPYRPILSEDGRRQHPTHVHAHADPAK